MASRSAATTIIHSLSRLAKLGTVHRQIAQPHAAFEVGAVVEVVFGWRRGNFERAVQCGVSGQHIE